MGPSTFNALSGTALVATTSGPAIPSQFMFALSAQAVVTGTGVGTLNIQASNDNPSTLQRDASGNYQVINWTNISAATVAITGAGSFLIPKLETAYAFTRVQYVFTSGSIALNVNCTRLDP